MKKEWLKSAFKSAGVFTLVGPPVVCSVFILAAKVLDRHKEVEKVTYGWLLLLVVAYYFVAAPAFVTGFMVGMLRHRLNSLLALFGWCTATSVVVAFIFSSIIYGMDAEGMLISCAIGILSACMAGSLCVYATRLFPCRR